MKLKDRLWIVVGFGIIFYAIYKIALNVMTDQRLKDGSATVTKAVIINKKNFHGNQPVHPTFSYSYLFIVGGKDYIGNSHDTSLKVGDTIEIKYVKDNPSMNRPLHYNE